MARTTAQTNPATGQPIYVGEGAVRQQGSKKLYSCNTCHRDVVWLESKRTGKMYLADVHRGEVVLYYISKPHNCRPITTEPSWRETYVAPESDHDREYREVGALFASRQITRDEFLARCDAIDAKYGVNAN